MKKVTYSSLSIHGHAQKNLYEEHVHVLLSFYRLFNNIFLIKKMSLKELAYLYTYMYIIHVISQDCLGTSKIKYMYHHR